MILLWLSVLLFTPKLEQDVLIICLFIQNEEKSRLEKLLSRNEN